MDFPHPEGPISAVTIDRSMVSETFSRTSRPLNQAQTPWVSSSAADACSTTGIGAVSSADLVGRGRVKTPI